MLQHYLAAAVRHFLRHKVTTILNIACLAFGLMCFLGVYGVIAYVRGSDSHIPHAQRVFALSQTITLPGSQSIEATSPSTAWAIAPQLKADFPQLEAVARLTNASPSTSGSSLKAGVAGMDAKVRFADAEVLDLLHLPLLAGNSQALQQPRSSVISKEAAVRLFGAPELALGKEVVLFGSTPLTVTGVLDEIPAPSHLSTKALANPFQRFDVLVSMDVFEARQNDPEALRSWGRAFVTTYVVLPADGSLTRSQLVDALPAFVRRHASASNSSLTLDLMPLSFITVSYYDGTLRSLRTGTSSTTLLQLLAGIVLLIACLNYSNLAAAQSATRAKEIGLHRVIGAGRTQIIVHHLVEAAIVVIVAGALALALLISALFFAPAFTSSPSASDFLIRNVLSSAKLWWAVLGTLCAVALAAGAYPALVLSNVRPIQALRSGQERSPRRRLAALIVGMQFASASFLLIALFVMQAQSEYLRTAAFGTLHDPLLVLANYADTPVDYQTLRTELLRQPHVKGVSSAAVAPWQIHGMGPAGISLTADPNATRRGALRNFINVEFFDTLEFELLAGRFLDAQHASDDFAMGSESGGFANIVVDRSFVEDYGWAPQEALGKTLYYWRTRNGVDSARPLQIVGVVTTKPLSMIEFGVRSNLYLLDQNADDAVIVRVSKDDVQAAVREIDATWNRVAPNLAIQRQFADQSLDSAMWMFSAIGRVFGSVAVFALIIATLGLIGISIHGTQRRTHEIGVRKTLGASAYDVLGMLLVDFSKPVVIANLIAWPLAYAVMRAALSIFTQSAGLSPAPFVVSFALTLLIAWLAVSAQVIRAAWLRPAQVLRYE